MPSSQIDNVVTLKESSLESANLKEYVNLKVQKIDSEISHLRELINKEKEISESKEDAKALALRHQFAETERRLDTLNHEAARLALMIPKDQFEIVINQLRKDDDLARDKIVELEKDKSNREGKMYAITFVWGLVLLFLSWFLKR